MRWEDRTDDMNNDLNELRKQFRDRLYGDDNMAWEDKKIENVNATNLPFDWDWRKFNTAPYTAPWPSPQAPYDPVNPLLIPHYHQQPFVHFQTPSSPWKINIKNVSKIEQKLTLTLDLPGVQSNDVDLRVSLRNGKITVKSKRFDTKMPSTNEFDVSGYFVKRMNVTFQACVLTIELDCNINNFDADFPINFK